MDVNTATQAELAAVVTISTQTAVGIIAERKIRPCANWPDLVVRVIQLRAAKTAVYASTCGLTVNGESLEGAPPNADAAALLQEEYSKYKR